MWKRIRYREPHVAEKHNYLIEMINKQLKLKDKDW